MSKSKKAAFMELYQPVHENFEMFCRARVYGDTDFKDFMHDTIFLAFEKFDRLEDPKAFLHFLFGISIRVLANTNRKQRLVHVTDEAQTIPDESLRADRNEDVEILYRALSQLPEAQREAIVLFEISGFSIQEISELQQSGLSAVKQRLVRGRQALLKLLQEPEFASKKETSV